MAGAHARAADRVPVVRARRTRRRPEELRLPSARRTSPSWNRSHHRKRGGRYHGDPRARPERGTSLIQQLADLISELAGHGYPYFGTSAGTPHHYQDTRRRSRRRHGSVGTPGGYPRPTPLHATWLRHRPRAWQGTAATSRENRVYTHVTDDDRPRSCGSRYRGTGVGSGAVAETG